MYGAFYFADVRLLGSVILLKNETTDLNSSFISSSASPPSHGDNQSNIILKSCRQHRPFRLELSAATTSTACFGICAYISVILTFCLTITSHSESISCWQSASNMMVMMTLRSALRSLPVNFFVWNLFLHPGFQHFHLLKVTLIILWAISLHL